MKIIKAFSASVLIHVFIFLTCYGMILLWKNSALSVVDIDLSGSTLMLRPSNKANMSKQPIESVRDWFISTGKNWQLFLKKKQ